MSLLLRHLDTRRYRLALPRAVALQMLHPSIAASFDEHVAGSMWAHKQRAVESLIRMAYRDEDASWQIRLAHEHVKGVDATGARYHALGPDLFHFVHATYVETLVVSIETYSGPLTADQRDELYLECCQWYRRYGVSDRPMPADWAAFVAYFDDACARLERTESGERYAREALDPPRWAFGAIPGFAARGIAHPRVRELMGVRQGTVERRTFEAFAAGLRATRGGRGSPAPR